MWDITIHPLKELGDLVGTTEQPVRSDLIPNVTARPNMSYIVHFEPYRPYGFVLGEASPLLSLTPQIAYNMLATSTTNKASYQTLTRRYGIFISNGYIHRYWNGPSTFASNGKCIGKYSIESKNNRGNIISSLHIV